MVVKMFKRHYEVWVTECKFSGTWKAGKRFCNYHKKWVSKEECESCKL